MKFFTLIFSFAVLLMLTACADYDNGREAFRAENHQEAKENLEPLAFTYDHAPSQVLLADIYMRTEPAETHGAKVKQLLESAAPIEEGKAYYIQAKTYERGYGVNIDGPRAIQLYQKADATGYWRGKYNIARMYDKGDVVAQDDQKAAMLYQDVINNHNYDRAKDMLFALKARQAIATNDLMIAEPYLQKMIAQGDNKAKVALAKMYRETYMDGSADAQILALYEQAAIEDERGRYWYDLGRIYEQGDLSSIEPNGAQAIAYYQQAVSKGYWRANYFIGRIYDRGRLVPQDRSKAIAFYDASLKSEEYEPAQSAKNKLLEKIAKEGSKSSDSIKKKNTSKVQTSEEKIK